MTVLSYEAQEKKTTILDIVTQRVKVTQSEMLLNEWIKPRPGNAPPEIIDDVLCQELARRFDFFIMGSIFWYYEGGVFKPDRSGSVIKTLIRMHLPQDLRKDPAIARIYRLLSSDANLVVEETDVNNHADHWINVKNGMFDVLKWQLFPHDPSYRSIAQIPHCFDGSDPPAEAGKVIQSFLDFALPNKQDQTTVFEMTGESCSVHVDFQKCIIFQGQGATGKSTLLNIITAIVGSENISGVPLQKLESRFYPVQLIGKLINLCTDLPSEKMPFTGNFKAAICGELLNDSYKGKDEFCFRSHAKMWFSCNELPVVSDTSDGFYRRVTILTMNNKPVKTDPKLTEKLTTPDELNYFIFHAFKAYAVALERGNLTESEAAADAVKAYRCSNDTTEGFLDERIEVTENKKDRILRSLLYSEYERYCIDLKAQPRNAKNFYEILRQKGFRETSIKGSRYFCYIRRKAATNDNEAATFLEDLETAERLFPQKGSR